MPLQIRRGTTAERTSIRPIIGELIYDTTLKQVFVGDSTDGGVTGTLGGTAVTAFGTEDAQDAVASVLSSGTHTGISFTYDDAANKISATVGGGVVVLDIKGSVFTDDTSTVLVDSVLGAINLDNTIRSNVIPYVDSTYDLGSAAKRFKDLYLSGSSLYVGNAVITATGSAINLPAGSTVGGVAIGSGSGDGVITGSNYNINIVADDSTVLLNSGTGIITAPGGFVGNLTGNVTGAMTGAVFGNVRSTNGVTVLNSGTTGDDASFVGIVTGDIYGSVLAEDSTVIVDQLNQSVNASGGFTGNLVGNVTGNLTGNVTGNLTGNVTGNLTGNVTGNLTGNVTGNLTGNVTGNLTGLHIGDAIGSVFAQDSTLLVNGVDGKIVGPIETNSILIDKNLGGILIESEGDVNDSYDLFTIKLANSEVDGSPKLQLRSRGTINSPTVILTGDAIASDYYMGYNGTTHIPAVLVTAKASGTVTTGGAVPGAFEISTLNNAGSLVSAFKVDHTQLVHVANNSVAAGGGSGQVNVGGGVVGYLKLNIGGTDYAIPYYGLNP
jgi:hypothetical protein